jgi:hypothetical protein
LPVSESHREGDATLDRGGWANLNSPISGFPA